MKRGACCRLAHGAALALAWTPLGCGAPSPLPATPEPTPTTAPAPVDAAPEAAIEEDGGPATASPASVPPAAQLLRDGFEQRHPERALPTAARGDAPPRTVVARAPGKARLIFDDSSLRVLVWAEDAALWETPLAVTALTRYPAKPGAKERVMVGPGAFVERKSEKNGFVRVSAHDRTFGVEGFLPASALGRVFVPAAVPEATGTEWWVLSREAAVLERPGGPALGKLLDTSGPDVQVAALSKGAAWFVEVAYHSSTLSVQGFVPKSALSQPEPGGWGHGYGSVGHKNPPEEKLTFPRGACLYAEPWGEVVGVLRLPRTASVHIEEGARSAWRELDLNWIGTRVWVAREGASATPPAKDDAVKSLPLAEGFSCVAPPQR